MKPIIMTSLAGCMAFLLLAPTEAEELKVISIGMFRDVLPTLKVDFTKRTGKGLVLDVETPGVVTKRILDGEAFDVAFVDGNNIEKIEKSGKVLLDTKAPIGRVYIAAAVRRGAPKPNVSSLVALKQAIRESHAVVINDPSGGSAVAAFLIKSFERLGFDESIRSKFKMVPGNGSKVAKAVADGAGDFGITVSSEIAYIPEAEIAGALPPEVQFDGRGLGVVSTNSSQKELAKDFIAFARTEAAKRLLSAKGVEPE